MREPGLERFLLCFLRVQDLLLLVKRFADIGHLSGDTDGATTRTADLLALGFDPDA